MNVKNAYITLLLLGITISISGRVAFAQGTAEGLFVEGYNYQTGKGVEPDEKRALAYYRQSLKVNPEFYESLYNAALIYHGRGEYTRAQNYFVKAARSAKKRGADASHYEAMARNGLGTCYQQMGKYDAAEKQFDVARRMNPSLVEAHYNLVNLLVRRERIEEARAALKMAERMAPSDRYEKIKGRLAVEEKDLEAGGFGGITGILLFVLLLLLYGVYLRRRSAQAVRR